PIVIAHRGASGYLPEHTLEAFERAIDLGADYIEPDLVITKDGALVVRHDTYLSTTTNVADLPEFSARKRALDDRTDWFVEDFTLAELKSLRARQAFPGRARDFDDNFQIPTFEEVIALVKHKARETGRIVGIYPETKAPAHYESLGFDFAALLVETLAANGLDAGGAKVYIQSLEPAILKRLKSMTELPLIMLVRPVSAERPHEPDMPLAEIATFADGIGAFKTLLINERGDSSGYVEAAHAMGLVVHAWTFRNDSYIEDRFSSYEDELLKFLRLGVDGIFSDFPDTAAAVRDAFRRVSAGHDSVPNALREARR
ncbi:MAG: glycerophosphodiester phosphodiesterase family protein, partial [Steroidobacteraceae bacterium]